MSMGFEYLKNSDDSNPCVDYVDSLNCRSYSPDQVKHILNNNNFSLLHLNTRSLQKHHDDLFSLMTITDHGFDVVGCSETWLNERSHIESLNIEGYRLINKNRSDKIGGGVCFYVRSKLNAIVCEDLIIDDGLSDSLFIEIKTSNTKKYVIGVVYRPPDSDFNLFRLKLELLFNLNRKNNP